MEKISVIIPTYNRSGLLIKAIESVLNQTYPVFEIIICDDGSDDGSKESVSQFSSQKLKWLDCGKNGMPSIPRNIGMQNAGGDWIAFLDSDDQWLPDKLEKQMRLLAQTGLKASSGNAFRMDSAGLNLGPYQQSGIPSSFSVRELLATNLVICSSAIMHTSLLKDVIGFPESKKFRAIEDYAFWLRVATLSDFVYSSDCLIAYRDDSTTSIRSMDDDTWIQRERIFDNYYHWCLDHKMVDAKFASWAKKEVKRAMKMNGVGFIKRMFY